MKNAVRLPFLLVSVIITLCAQVPVPGPIVGGGGSGGSSVSTRTYNFGGTNQAGVGAWAVNFTGLTNITYSTTDSTHLRTMLVVAANAVGSVLYTVTPVTSANPSVVFEVDARSTDNANPGSMALSYACVAAGTAVDNPTPVALSALSLATIGANKSVYQSTQTVTCTGTSASPADLYVFWTATAPSGGTLSLIKLALTYL